MSNNEKPIDFGYADTVKKPSVHHEVQRRHNEIVQIMRELSDEEHIDALFAFASKKWHRLNNGENTDFKARNEDLNISVK